MASRKRQYVWLIVVLWAVGAGLLGYHLVEGTRLVEEKPETHLVCTSSATYTPGVGEQKTKLVCKEE